jgi:hypothetical protein
MPSSLGFVNHVYHVVVRRNIDGFFVKLLEVTFRSSNMVPNTRDIRKSTVHVKNVGTPAFGGIKLPP